MQEEPDTWVVLVCQLAGVVAAAFVLPSALVDLAFHTDTLTIVSQVVLAAFALALIASLWKGESRQ